MEWEEMPFNDTASRDRTRICIAYGLTPRLPAGLGGRGIGGLYDFGRLAGHVQSGRDLLPRVLLREEIIDGKRPGHVESVSLFPVMQSLCVAVTVTPRGDPVLLLDGEIKDNVSSEKMAEVLAATCFERSGIRVSGELITDWMRARLANYGARAGLLDFGSDVHQCIFPGSTLQQDLRSLNDSSRVNQLAAQLLYRGMVPVDSGSLLGIHVPAALNDPGSTFVAHGRGVSILCGWTVPLENAFALTAISTVSALGALRRARHEAFDAMALTQNADPVASNGRVLVSRLSDQLNEMQLDLSFGVETHIDSILIPEMMVEGFQRSLSSAVGIRESLDNTSRMLERVATVISVRLSKLEAADRERIERRDRLVAVLVAVASLLAFPPALLLAFFGINARQVRSNQSIFDLHAYWGAYLLAWLPFVILVSAGSFLYSRVRGRRAPAETSEP